MDAPTVERMLTDLLLIEVSDALDDVARQMRSLLESSPLASFEDERLGQLARIVTDLQWWSGRLLGGVSFAPEVAGSS